MLSFKEYLVENIEGFQYEKDLYQKSFKVFLTEATFNYNESKYLIAVLDRIFNKEAIKIGKTGDEDAIVCDITPAIKKLKKEAELNPDKALDNLKKQPNSAIFTNGNVSYKWTNIFKGTFSGFNKKSLNAFGKELADAGERATLLYLQNKFTKPEETGESLFINNPSAFDKWLPTFIKTREIIEKVVGNIGTFEIIHDGSPGDFTNEIAKFCKRVSINPNTWNPADVWFIKKSKYSIIVNEIKNIDSLNVNSGVRIELMNGFIYSSYLNKDLYPVSLKQINPKQGVRVELNNAPGKSIIKPKTAGKLYFTNCNLTLNSMEIGGFILQNKTNGKNIQFQNKGYPASSLSTQVEITNDGSDSGGRLGKVPASIIGEIFNNSGMEKINPSDEFGRDFKNFDKIKAKRYFTWYSTATKFARKIEHSFASHDALYKYITSTVETSTSKEIKILGHKIQGLQMQYMLASRTDDELTDIMNKMVFGAMKISPSSGFFIKIY